MKAETLKRTGLLHGMRSFEESRRVVDGAVVAPPLLQQVGSEQNLLHLLERKGAESRILLLRHRAMGRVRLPVEEGTEMREDGRVWKPWDGA
jgi:hypothetical protein